MSPMLSSILAEVFLMLTVQTSMKLADFVPDRLVERELFIFISLILKTRCDQTLWVCGGVCVVFFKCSPYVCMASFPKNISHGSALSFANCSHVVL